MAERYGPATVDQAIELATEGGVTELVLFHHSPARTDAQLAALVDSIAAPMPVTVATEGDERRLGRPTAASRRLRAGRRSG